MNLVTSRAAWVITLSTLISFSSPTVAQGNENSGVVSPPLSLQQLFEQGSNLVKQGSEAEGIAKLRAAAEQGHAASAFELASLYELGLGVERDFQLAREFYYQAIKQGHRDAHYNMALLLINEKAPFRNLAKARQLMMEIARRGDIEAQYTLAVLLNDSLGVTDADPLGAIDWLHKAAENGHGKAQLSLGMHFLKGEIVESSPQQAFHWFSKASAQNIAGAQYNLALMYERGEGTAVNSKAAISWYKSAAALGDANARQNLGIKYLLGEEIPADPEKGIGLITKAAKAGLSNSRYLLGQIFQYGYENLIAIDLGRAEHWLLQAAKQGHTEAQYQLAVLLLAKEGGQKDARFWIQQAIAAGHPDALALQANL